MRSLQGKNLSVVVPVFGGKESLNPLVTRLQSVVKARNYNLEIILVDDGNPEPVWQEIERLSQSFDFVTGVKLSRNFGQHAAITAGIHHATGQFVAVMDCDLEDPPEELPRFLEVMEKDPSIQVVLAKRMRRRHGWVRLGLAKIFSRVMKWTSGNYIDPQLGTFSLISRTVADSYLRLVDRNRHYLHILNWLGFKTQIISIAQAARYHGQSSYTFKRLVRHALDGLFFQSTRMLHLVLVSGLLCSVGGMALATYFVVSYYYFSALPGWTSLAILILVLSGIILISIGACALYISEIFEQVKMRPIFLVETVSGLPIQARDHREVSKPKLA